MDMVSAYPYLRETRRHSFIFSSEQNSGYSLWHATDSSVFAPVFCWCIWQKPVSFSGYKRSIFFDSPFCSPVSSNTAYCPIYFICIKYIAIVSWPPQTT